MSYCARLFFYLLLPTLLWGHPVSHRVTENNGFTTIHIMTSEPAHLNPEGIVLNTSPLTPSKDIPLPFTTTFKTPLSPATLKVYACLDNGQCLKPYEATIQSLNTSLIQIIFTSILLAISSVFNPCLAPLWLIVSSQLRKNMLGNSFLMGGILLAYQTLLQIFGTQMISISHHLGMDEAAHFFLLTCLTLVLFSNKITLPPLVKNHGKLPSFIAIILSSSCLLPLQLGAASTTASMPPFNLAMGALFFYLTTSLGFWLIANFSQKAYQKTMTMTPIAMRILAMGAITYLLLSSPPTLSLAIPWAGALFLLTLKPPFHPTDLLALVLICCILVIQTLQPNSSIHHTLDQIEQAKLSDHQTLYVTADWCPACQTLKSRRLKETLWLDITHMSPSKEEWLNAHSVSFLPSCFISKNQQWIPCPSHFR